MPDAVPDQVAGAAPESTDAVTSLPTMARVAAGLLVIVGLANAVAGVVALVVVPGELQASAAVGLTVAGVVTVVVGVLVWRRHLAALYVALGVFELLLVARLVTSAGAGGSELVALVLLVAMVAVLWVATSQVRRRRRA